MRQKHEFGLGAAISKSVTEKRLTNSKKINDYLKNWIKYADDTNFILNWVRYVRCMSKYRELFRINR